MSDITEQIIGSLNERYDALLEKYYPLLDMHAELTAENEALRTDLEAVTIKRDILAAQIEAIRMRDNHRDAEVIERAVESVNIISGDDPLDPAVVYVDELFEYADQLRQQAKESQP